jgi:alcohol dehydrogenase class IV
MIVSRGACLSDIPATYSGAEWTASYGIRDASARTKTGGTGARTVAIVYEPELGASHGLPHGTMNAVSLPAALRFNSIAAPGQLARFGEANGPADPLARVGELAALAGSSRLRDYESCPGRTCPGGHS